MKKIVKVELIQLLKKVIKILEREDVPENIKKLTIEEINPEDIGREDIQEL
jgi:hypothetical protein